MKLILSHDVSNLGVAGEVVTVKDGYGRNFLIPRGYAVAWTKGAQRQIDQMAAARRKRATEDIEAAQAAREALETTPVVIEKAAGSNGRLFGGVNTADVAKVASEVAGKAIDRREVNLASTIKSVGEFAGVVKLHADITAQIKIVVKAAK